MPRQVGRARIIALAILSIAFLSIALAVLAQTQAQPKPFMTITGEGSRIDYYNVSSTTAPTLVMRVYLNNTPVPVMVGLSALTKMYTMGYYYGIDMVSINLLLNYRNHMGVEYYWTMNIVINGSGYYLNYLPYLYFMAQRYCALWLGAAE